MADTIQGVSWALEQACPMRQSADWKNPQVALSTLREMQSISMAQKLPRSEFGIFDGVYVAANCWSARYPYPERGHVVEKAYAPHGGCDAVVRLCGNCPANSGPGDVPGCTGWFHHAFYKKEEEQLARIVRDLRLEDRIDTCFPKTTRLWFSFWINSPIPKECSEVLYQILSAVHEEDGKKWHEPEKQSEHSQYKRMARFLSALKRSIDENLPMHVRFAPPGHSDLGFDTTFPHCPRCKAPAPGKLWRRKYPVEPETCSICGNTYSPAVTASSKPWEPEKEELREILGKEKFAQFAARYLVARGASETEAGEIVREREDRHDRQTVIAAQKREFWRKEKRYLDEVVFRGLSNQATSEEGEDWGDTWLFSATDFLELLKRCEAQHIDVYYVQHVSASGEEDRNVLVKHDNRNAIEVFECLVNEGLNERFTTNLKVHEGTVNAWWGRRPDSLA
jgi:hypothetical protein